MCRSRRQTFGAWTVLGVLVGTGPIVAGSTIETVFIVQHAHADVGFNAAPSVMQQRNHERTVAALDLADAYPDFHWVIETGYQLEGFLDRASPANVDRLRARLAEGRFSYGANYTNLHSGLCGEEQLHRVVYPSTRRAAELGVPARTALLNDVPGFTAAMPRVLADAGVPYAVLGPNDFLGGKPRIPLSDRPFWWQGRDGSRVLTWMTYGSYIEGYFEWGLFDLNTAKRRVRNRLEEFIADGYPYDAVLAIRAADDEIPDDTLVTLVAQWNAEVETPKLRLATPSDFFEHLLSRYGDDFPVYSGDASGFWESVSMTTPDSTRRVRRARTRLPDVEALWATASVTRGAPYPFDDLDEAWKLSLVLDEHSNGGMGWPGLLTRDEIWRENREFVAVATRTESLTETLAAAAAIDAAAAVVPADESAVVIHHPLGAAFEGIVEIDFDAPQPADLRLVDPDTGDEAPFRWTASDRSALAVRTAVPGFGWRRYRLASGGSAPAPPALVPGDTLTAGHLRLTVDPAVGTATSLVDTETGVEWLGGGARHRFAGIERGSNQQVFIGISESADLAAGSVVVEQDAPLFRRLLVRHADGSVLREYYLYEDELRVDVRMDLHEAALPAVPFDQHSHHYAVAFPAALTLPTTLWVDGPDGEYRPGPDSLVGTALGHFATATGARLVGADGRWMAISSPDAPMLDLGEMNEAAGKVVETHETALTWKLARHADLSQVVGGAIVPMLAEPGLPGVTPFEFRIRFGSAGDAPPDRARLRRDLAPPLVSVVADGTAGAPTPGSGTFLDVADAEVVAMKRSDADDGLVLRLRAGSSAGTASVIPSAAPVSAWRTDLVERPIEPLTVVDGRVEVPLVANGVVTVLLRY